MGWGQYESDKTVDYADGGTYIFSGDKELFALWQKHTFDGGVVLTGEISGIGYAADGVDTLKIYGMPGSTAEAFAKDHGFAFAQLPEMMK